MRYFVTSSDDTRRERYVTRLKEQGYEVIDQYCDDAVIITLGGDGSILYAARNYSDPTILPARTSGSEGHKTELDANKLLTAVERLETGRQGEDYQITRHCKLAAYSGGKELNDDFDALNDISLHHASPVLAAVFATRICDRDMTYEFERIIGDGLVVATPFGATAYYQSITGGTFTDGIGVAFNNVHTPMDIPEYVLLSDEGVVEVEMLRSEHASSAVLTRDNDIEMYELSLGEVIKIRPSDNSVELVELEG